MFQLNPMLKYTPHLFSTCFIPQNNFSYVAFIRWCLRLFLDSLHTFDHGHGHETLQYSKQHYHQYFRHLIQYIFQVDSEILKKMSLNTTNVNDKNLSSSTQNGGLRSLTQQQNYLLPKIICNTVSEIRPWQEMTRIPRPVQHFWIKKWKVGKK